MGEDLFSLSLAGMANDHVVPVLFELGETQHALKRNEEARQTLEQALAMQERIFGKDHACLSPTLQSLADVYADAYADDIMLQKAAVSLERALHIIECGRGPHTSMR